MSLPADWDAARPGIVRARPRSSAVVTASLDGLINRFRGDALEVSFRDLVGPLPADEGAHNIHPYPARLVRHIPRFLLGAEQLSSPGDLVLDPFCGSGTVLLEAMHWRRAAWGIDTNPLATLIARVKTSQPAAQSLSAAIEMVVCAAMRLRRHAGPDLSPLQFWFSAGSLDAFSRVRFTIAKFPPGETADFLYLALSATVEALAHKDRRVPVPVRPKGTSIPEITATEVVSRFRQVALQMAARLGANRLRENVVQVRNGDARNPELYPPAPGAHLILTSPPYGAAQKYLRSTSHSLIVLGTDPTRQELRQQFIGREHFTNDELEVAPVKTHSPALVDFLEDVRSVNARRAAIYDYYFAEMRAAIDAQVSALRTGGAYVLVSSTNSVAGNRLETHRHLADMLCAAGLTPMLVLEDRIRARSLLTKRASTAGEPILHEYVHIFRKEASE